MTFIEKDKGMTATPAGDPLYFEEDDALGSRQCRITASTQGGVDWLKANYHIAPTHDDEDDDPGIYRLKLDRAQAQRLWDKLKP